MLNYLLLSGLLPGLLLAHGATAQAPAHTVLVRGTAERELDPEKLDLLLTYRFTDNVKTGERAQTQEESLQQVLSQAGLGASKLVLEELSASGYGGLSKVNNTSVALTKVYRLTLDNPQLVSTLLPQLAQTGADNLRVVNLQSTKLAAAKMELVAQAVADARHKASVAGQAADGKVGAVVAIIEVLPAGPSAGKLYQEEYQKLRVDGYTATDRTVEATTPSLRKIKLTAAYDVVFELKP